MHKLKTIYLALFLILLCGCETTSQPKEDRRKIVSDESILGKDPSTTFQDDNKGGNTYIYALINLPHNFITYPGIEKSDPILREGRAEILHVIVNLKLRKTSDGQSVFGSDELPALDAFMTKYNKLSMNELKKRHIKTVDTTPASAPH